MANVEKPVKGQLYTVRWLRIKNPWCCVSVDEAAKTVALVTRDSKKRINDVKWEDLHKTS